MTDRGRPLGPDPGPRGRPRVRGASASLRARRCRRASRPLRRPLGMPCAAGPGSALPARRAPQRFANSAGVPRTRMFVRAVGWAHRPDGRVVPCVPTEVAPSPGGGAAARTGPGAPGRPHVRRPGGDAAGGPTVTCTRLPWTRRATPGAARRFPARPTAGAPPDRLVGTVRPAFMTGPHPAASASRARARPVLPLGARTVRQGRAGGFPVGARAPRGPSCVRLSCGHPPREPVPSGPRGAPRWPRPAGARSRRRLRERGPLAGEAVPREGRSPGQPGRRGTPSRQGPGLRIGGTPLPCRA